MKAWERIGEAIADAFAKTDGRFREEFLENYRRKAEFDFKAWMDTLAKPESKQQWGRSDGRGYVRYDPPKAYAAEPRRHEERQAQADRYSADFERAARDALGHYASAKEQFLYKNTMKFRAVLGNRDDLIDGKVTFGYDRGLFAGVVEVKLSNASFSADVGVKYVFRTIPNYTPYFQYPLTFRNIRVDGAVSKRMSERELAVALGTSVGGLTLIEAEERDKKAKKQAYSKELERLNTLKFQLSHIASDYSGLTYYLTHADLTDPVKRKIADRGIKDVAAEVARRAAKANIVPVPASEAEAKALLKIVNAQLKALKEAQ